MSTVGDLARAVEEGSAESAERLTRAALSEGLDPVDVMRQGLQAGLAPVGERFNLPR